MRDIVIAVAMLAGSVQGRAQPPAIGAVGWLSGCWHMESNGRAIDEVWMPARGGMMLGMSRAVRGDKVMSYEFLRIYVRSDTLVYAASPSGQKPAEFAARLRVRDSVAFENSAHDFPQRVIYMKARNNSLEARVEGTINGRIRSQNFRYQRVRCGP